MTEIENDALGWRASLAVGEMFSGHLEPTDLNRVVMLLHMLAVSGSKIGDGDDDMRLLLSLASELEGLTEGRPSYALDPHVVAKAHGLDQLARTKQSSTADSLKHYCVVAVRGYREFMPASQARAVVIEWAARAGYVIGDSTLRLWATGEADLRDRIKSGDETHGLRATFEGYRDDRDRLKAWLDGFVRERVISLAKRESYFKALQGNR